MSNTDPAIREKLISALEVSDAKQRGARADRIVWMGHTTKDRPRSSATPSWSCLYSADGYGSLCCHRSLQSQFCAALLPVNRAERASAPDRELLVSAL